MSDIESISFRIEIDEKTSEEGPKILVWFGPGATMFSVGNTKEFNHKELERNLFLAKFNKKENGFCRDFSLETWVDDIAAIENEEIKYMISRRLLSVLFQ